MSWDIRLDFDMNIRAPILGSVLKIIIGGHLRTTMPLVSCTIRNAMGKEIGHSH